MGSVRSDDNANVLNVWYRLPGELPVKPVRPIVDFVLN